MTQVIQQVNINLIPQIFGANSVLVPCSQYDKSYRVIQFNVYNGRELYSIPSTCTVIIRGTKKDLTGFEYNCEFSGSQVIFPLEPQITVLSGKVPAELRIVNGEELIGSANFLFMVEPSPLTDDTIISETQLPLLEEALQAAAEAEQSRILAEVAKNSAEESATNASESEANALTYSQNAQASANSASQSASNALTSEQNAKESEDLAQGYSEDAQGYASNASDSATSAEASATRAEEAVEDIETYVTEAQGYAEQSHTSAQNASQSASNALTSETNAHTSELNAKASEDNAKTSETNASASATSASQSATSASASASNASTSATQSANSATSAEESATEAQNILDNIDSLIENKADNDGIYPNMSVGSAEKLMTSETVDDEFTYQVLKHDGYARINSVKGNTIVWNQLADDSTNTHSAEMQLTQTGHSFAMTTAQSATWLRFPLANKVAGHKYLVSFDASYGQENAPCYIRVRLGATGTYVDATAIPSTVKHYDLLIVADSVAPVMNFVFEKVGTYTFANPQLFDLTQMGLDVTADQFRSLYPLNYYQYNSGELLSFNGTGIKTVGFNLWDEEWESGIYSITTGVKQPYVGAIRCKNFIPAMPNKVYYFKTPTASSRILYYDENEEFIDLSVAFGSNTFTTPSNCHYITFFAITPTYNNDICINFSSSKNGTYAPYSTNTLELPISQYFPTGMKSAGTVYDELTEKKAITRIGAVDLGTLNWFYNTTNNYFTVNIPNIAEGMNYATEIPWFVVPRYTYKGAGVGWANMADKTFGFNNKEIRLKDTSYTNSRDFVSSLQGVIAYYGIATPTETDIDIDLTYMIVSGGTEQLLPINGSVPVTSPLSRNVSFFYDSNVVANLLTLLSSVAQIETSPTTHAYSVGDYLMYNYQLYRVTSAIAVGGTLTIGTNIVATTLIDVIKSL